MSRVLEPLQYPFMVDAMIVGAAVGAVCAVLSCYLVLKGWSLMGDAVSHAVLPGIVGAYAIGVPLALGAFASGLLCAVLTGYVKANSRVKEDTAMGVVFTGLFALGLVMFTKVPSDLHLDHILFGNILGLEEGDLRNTLITAGATLAVVLGLRRDLLLFCFDPGHARTIGLPTQLLYYLLLSLLAVTIVVSLQAVGVILVIAMLVTPGCIGYLWSDRFGRMMAIATGSAIGASVLGVYASFFLNASTGACIVLFEALMFAVALVTSRKRGLRRNRRTATATVAKA